MNEIPYTIYVEMGGLMEDPTLHWEVTGTVPASSPQEAARKLYAGKPDFDSTTLRYWGWRLGYRNKQGGITVL